MSYIGRIRTQGRAVYLLLPKNLLERMVWREGDHIALREAGEKLVCERVPLEKLAILRTGESQAQPIKIGGTD